jgi:Rps23 Pro-64 3,4-dihydroxylase Tpa1-like proline 4-hydroxylase
MEDKYFYINNDSISRELCKTIINMFDLDKNKYEGVTHGGLNKDVKDTQDLMIPNSPEKTGFDKWEKVHNFLEKELAKNLKQYTKILDDIVVKNHERENTSREYRTFGDFLTNQSFMIQRYTKRKGRYIYHNDFRSDHKNKKYRVITYLWYLNTVEEGGETEFWGGTHKIKPEAGKLLLFPASWTFPHRGKMPLSSDKYIITGWLYLHN